RHSAPLASSTLHPRRGVVNIVGEKAGAGDGERKADIAEEGDQEDGEEDGAEAQRLFKVPPEPGKAAGDGDVAGGQRVVQVLEAQEGHADEGREDGMEHGADPGDEVEEEQGDLDGAEKDELQGLVDDGASEGPEGAAGGREGFAELGGCVRSWHPGR